MGGQKDGIAVTTLLALSFRVSAQDDDAYEYQTEMIWGITKNTASGLIGGFTLKYSRARTAKIYETFGLEIVNVKHPKEVRYNSIITGNFFIWGKQRKERISPGKLFLKIIVFTI